MDEKISSPPVRGQKLGPSQAMRWAVFEAARGAAFVSPNPMVGCVVLDADDGFLASGFHQKYGEAHAEVNALRNFSPEELRGAQVFVTLEPCAHQGKTPSCARMMATLPLGKVFFGLVDPNPLVSGQGAKILNEAGIPCRRYSDVFGKDLDEDLEASCEAFLWNQRHKKIFVSLKVAASLDGKIALANGESKWITGPESRELAHALRGSHDATMVGAGTLRQDNPSLDIRHPQIQRPNRVVVVEGTGRSLANRQSLDVFKVNAVENLFWVVRRGVQISPEAKAGVRILEVDSADEQLDIEMALQLLWDAGLRSVLVEGGARLSGSFLRAGCVNRLHLFQAPVILGESSRSWNEGFQVSSMAQKPVLQRVKTQTLGRDSHLTGLLRNPHTGDHFRDV